MDYRVTIEVDANVADRDEAIGWANALASDLFEEDAILTVHTKVGDQELEVGQYLDDRDSGADDFGRAV